MSLIVDAYFWTPDGDRKLALYDIMDRDEPYFGDILSFGPVKIAATERTGGYIKPQFGSTELSAEVFSGELLDTYLHLTASIITSSGDVQICDARGQLKELSESSATYDLYGTGDYDDTANGSQGPGTIEAFFDAYCSSSYLNITHDYTGDGTPEYGSFTPTGERNLLELMNEIAIWSSHAFYIEGATLYCFDLEADPASTHALTPYDFFDDEVQYEAPTPYSLYKGGDYYVSGSFNHGAEYSLPYVLHTTQAYIEACLTKKKTLLQKWWVTITLPIGTNNIIYGDAITFTDNSKYISLDVEMRAREFHYTLGSGQEYMKISGEATIAAA